MINKKSNFFAPHTHTHKKRKKSTTSVFSIFIRFYKLYMDRNPVLPCPLSSPALPEEEDEPPAQKVDRLVLHQSGQSSSSSADLGQRSPKDRTTQTLGVSAGLQRPETSRGRPGRASDAQTENTETSAKKEGSPLEEEPHWKAWMDREKDKEKEERSTRQKEEEKERLRREVEQKLEEERERLLKEKETRMRLLQEELRREEEEEERKLREESEKKLR